MPLLKEPYTGPSHQTKSFLVNRVSTNQYTSSSVKVGMLFKCPPTQTVPTRPSRFGSLGLFILNFGTPTLKFKTVWLTLDKHVGLFSSDVNTLETLHITTTGN